MYIRDDFLNFSPTIRKCAVSLLPLEPSLRELLIIYPLRGASFYILEQVRYGLRWPHTKKDVKVVGHAIDSEHLVFMILNDTSDVFVQFIFPFILYLVLSILNRKYRVNVNLGIGVWHASLNFNPNLKN